MTFLERRRKIKEENSFSAKNEKKPKMIKYPIFGAENENEFRSEFSLMA